MSKVKLLERDAFWDSNTAGKSKVHFIPRRRGQAKITWPLAPKKALILLTGRTPLSRALDAYESFFRARRRTFPRHLPRFSSRKIREQAMNGPWTKKFFREEAEEYCLYPRKGFQVERQKKRISKLLSSLELK
jgi:hypothetical protein